MNTTLERVLLGPTSRTDGTENLVGAIRAAMGMRGAQTIHEFHSVELIVAPSIKTEGKKHQLALEQSQRPPSSCHPKRPRGTHTKWA